MNRKLAIGVVILIICVLLAAGGYFLVKPILESRSAETGLESEQVHQEDVATISYDGKQYRYKKDLETVLFIGLDASLEADYIGTVDEPDMKEKESNNESANGKDVDDVLAQDDRPGESGGYNNQVQSDFVTLILLDHEAEKVNILQLNRDTICSIPILDTKGEVAGKQQAQLALAHTYGSGGRDSCVNVRKTVKDLLYGAKIDHFFRISTKSIGPLNDLVGGVTLTLEDDFSFYDKSMKAGKTMKLMGEQAEVFVRSRKQMAEPTNVARMKRQKVYMEKWLDQAKLAISERAQDLLSDGIRKISNDLESDMSIYQLADVIECAESYELGEIVIPEGKAEKAGEYMAFYVDEDALMKTVVELFYEEM